MVLESVGRFSGDRFHGVFYPYVFQGRICGWHTRKQWSIEED